MSFVCLISEGFLCLTWVCTHAFSLQTAFVFTVSHPGVLQQAMQCNNSDQNSRQKVFNRGTWMLRFCEETLRLCGGLDMLKIDQNSTDL